MVQIERVYTEKYQLVRPSSLCLFLLFSLPKRTSLSSLSLSLSLHSLSSASPGRWYQSGNQGVGSLKPNFPTHYFCHLGSAGPDDALSLLSSPLSVHALSVSRPLSLSLSLPGCLFSLASFAATAIVVLTRIPQGQLAVYPTNPLWGERERGRERGASSRFPRGRREGRNCWRRKCLSGLTR